MDILGMGIDYTTGDPLVGALDERTFGQQAIQSLYHEHDRLLTLTTVPSDVAGLREEASRIPTPDYSDPRAAGWTYLINGSDPRRAEIIEIMKPLARQRGMVNPEAPLIYAGEAEDGWWRWIELNMTVRELSRPPFYLLIIGGPEYVPFHFQAFLQTTAAVGRVDFATLDDLQTYVAKVLRLENAPEPLVERETIFFAPEYPPKLVTSDATYYSRHHLAEPLARHVRDACGFATHDLAGDAATKDALLAKMRNTQPALVFVASHGLAAPGESFDVQRQVNGAICCQKPANAPRERWLLAAADIAPDQRLMDGSIMFQFTCFGYGTPARSDYAHWSPGLARVNTGTDFIAALPRRLLALPHGPLGFIGHVDAAWVLGFHTDDQPQTGDHWKARMAPFAAVITHLLHDLQPIGLAMAPIGRRYNTLNGDLAAAIDRVRRGDISETAEFRANQAQTFILRNDAQNYMVFGDPAVRLRVPTPG